MTPITRLAQQEPGAANHDLLAEIDKGSDHLAQTHQDRAAAIDRQHIDAERGLQRRVAIELVQHHIGRGVTLQLDHHAHALAIALVAQISDALDAFLADKLGDTFNQGGLVHLERNGGDDDGFAVFADLFYRGLTAHDHRAAARHQRIASAGPTDDLATGGEVGTRHDVEQLVQTDIWIVDQRQTGIDDFAQIVRRDIGRHANGNAACPIDQQVGNAGWQDDRLLFFAVIIVFKINGIEVNIGQQRRRRLGHPALGIAHLGRWIAVDRSEVALPVDKQQAHRERLGHPHQGVIDRLVTMRVQTRQHVADHAGRFRIGAIGRHAQLAHREQDAAVNRL